MTAPPPAEVTPLAAAATARAVQLAIRAALLRDVTRLWPILDSKRLDETFPGWLAAMRAVLHGYHGQSSTAAGRYYQQARSVAIQSPTPATLIRLAPKPGEQWLERALGFAGPGMLARDVARPNSALSTTLGTAARIALAGGRTTVLDTVHHDPVAVGWYRMTDGNPCAFCALLASRGIVYKEHTADFKTHNDCGCFGAPAFSRDQELPEISRIAAEVYRERGKGDPLVAFRKAWADRQAQDGSSVAGAGGGANPPSPPASRPGGADNDPPDRDREAWRAIQDSLDFDAHGETLEPNEIRFVRNFLALGHELDWVPKDRSMRPTNDFIWVDNGNLPVELKSTLPRYPTIRRAILDAVVKAERQHVVKNSFVIDLANQPLTPVLRDQIAGYNVGRRHYRIAQLWVMSAGVLEQIPLK